MSASHGTRTQRYPARQQIVLWGCAIHRTPRGQECRGCADQRELFTRADIRPDCRRAR